jgi:hypothetical protein
MSLSSHLREEERKSQSESDTRHNYTSAPIVRNTHHF